VIEALTDGYGEHMLGWLGNKIDIDRLLLV
jgi:hypothetical protein